MELKIPEPFLQKHLEAFQVALQKAKNENEKIVFSVLRRYVVEAAIDVGWVGKFDVSEHPAGEVQSLGNEILDKVDKVTRVPKN